MRRPYLTAVGLVLVAASLVALAVTVLHPLWRGNRARSWPATTCEITSKQVVDSEDTGGRRSIDAQLRYRYEVAGRTYQGWRHDFRPFRGGGVAAREVRHLYAGARVPCRVDPDDPTVAVLVPRGWSGLPAAIVLVCAIGAVALVAVGVGRRGGGFRRVTRRDDGTVRIRTRGAHPALAGSLAALTALTAPAVFLALGEDDGVFGIGFALLGLVVALRSAYVAGAFATGVDVELARQTVRPGEWVTRGWKVRSPLPPRTTGARLIAREEVEYRVDDSRDFEQAIVVDRGLRLLVELPADAMPSLTSGPCRYRWSIAVSAEIRGWPDLDVELDLDVEPGPPGERLRGQVPEAPEGGVLELRWRATSSRGSHETVVARQVIEKPDDGGSPFRAAGPPIFSFPDPVHPPAYQGKLFQIEWRVVLVVDGKDVHAIDVPVRMAR